MPHFILTLFIVFSSISASAIEAKVLSQETQSWDGTRLEYPKGQAEISIAEVKINGGEKLDFHCHPVPSAAYVIEGDLQVTLKDGKNKQFHKGDTITEVVHRAHSGTNLSETKPVVLIVFYAGEKGTPITSHKVEECRD